jgi:FkbM family methyltransferase
MPATTIMGRSSSRVLAALFHLPEIFRSLFGTLEFRDSITLINAYLQRQCPRNLHVETRSGYKIRLSGDADDLVTILSVIGRREYGSIPSQGVVIDVGAHLGAFALYAGINRAKRVYCYEPDPALYEVLVTNIRGNNFHTEILPTQAAVLGKTSGKVVFYPEGNASGHVDRRAYDTDKLTVDAVTLTEIVRDNDLREVHLLKLDCEGSEYEIIFETPAEIWSQIKSVRLEYHRGNTGMLERRLRDLGYRIVRHRRRTKNTGILWVDRGPYQ